MKDSQPLAQAARNLKASIEVAVSIRFLSQACLRAKRAALAAECITLRKLGHPPLARILITTIKSKRGMLRRGNLACRNRGPLKNTDKS
jgi:hypothetical protein